MSSTPGATKPPPYPPLAAGAFPPAGETRAPLGSLFMPASPTTTIPAASHARCFLFRRVSQFMFARIIVLQFLSGASPVSRAVSVLSGSYAPAGEKRVARLTAGGRNCPLQQPD